MADKELRLHRILEDFPFKRKDNQLERLADFFAENACGNQKHVCEQTGISQPTIRRIKDSFSQLDVDQRAVLIGHITDVLYARALSDKKE